MRLVATEAPYGSWKSPITANSCVNASGDYAQLVSDGSELYYLESLPAENGRLTIKRLSDGTELTPAPISVRNRVNEYGGGSYHVREGFVVWCDDSQDGIVTLRDPAGNVRYLTSVETDYRYGDLRVHPDLGFVLAVREDHSTAGEPITTIVAIPLDSPGDIVLCAGADFYGNPELSDVGELAWFEWNHPSMPWDETTLKVGQLVTDGVIRVTKVCVVAGGPGSGVSIQYPKWTSMGLVYLSDITGYWTPTLWTGSESRTLCKSSHDFCLGFWVLGNADYAELSLGQLLVRSFVDGSSRLSILDVSTGELRTLAEFAFVESVASVAGVGYAKVSWLDAAPGIVRVTQSGIEPVDGGALIPSDYLSVAEPRWIEGSMGQVHAWYYAPSNCQFCTESELPPMIVTTHGGPTALARSSYDPSKQFWTSRGFAILDVNYSGSSGFGRAYRQRLNSNWGVLDVADVLSCVADAIDGKLCDPQRIAISGGSAGGYLTLQSLVSVSVFAAGVSSYGIADLNLLVDDTHKFESHYPENLLGRDETGNLPTDARSPINHLDRLSAPMLILQGTEDKIVPPNQALELVAALNAAELPVALIMFAEEGHGFRQAANRVRALEAQLSFYAQIFGFEPADQLEQLEIANLA